MIELTETLEQRLDTEAPRVLLKLRRIQPRSKQREAALRVVRRDGLQRFEHRRPAIDGRGMMRHREQRPSACAHGLQRRRRRSGRDLGGDERRQYLPPLSGDAELRDRLIDGP